MGRKFLWAAAAAMMLAAVPCTVKAEDETPAAAEALAQTQGEAAKVLTQAQSKAEAGISSTTSESGGSYGPAGEAQFWEQINSVLEDQDAVQNLKTKYAVTEAPIYREPQLNGEVLDTSMVNTSFEVITERDGWTAVTTQSGVAFLRTDALADEPTEKWRLNYSDEDLYVMAHALAGESQDCSDEEQRYVGSVILNRVAHPEFPGTIKGVVFQRGQYACTRDGNYYREPTQRNWANAKWLLENGSVLPASVIWQSGQRQGKGVYVKTRYHYYCY